MDFDPRLHAEDQRFASKCRCCLTGSCCKDITETHEFYDCGQPETYEEMLRNTFDIQFQVHQRGNKAVICEKCIVRLCEAKNFKDMVIQSNETFLNLMNNIFAPANTIIEPIIRETEIKVENSADCVTPCDTTFDGTSDDDDKILSNLKQELNIKMDTNTDRPTPKQPTGGTSSTKRKQLQPKTNTENSKHKKQKDWLKIAERRGNGPLLRETSIKLISNSTVCVFQWNKSRYRCFCCTKPFSDIHQLRTHTNTVHTLENIEKKIIAQQNRLVKVEISDLFCKICGDKLETLDKLKEHLKLHDLRFESQEDLLVPFKIDSNVLQCQLCFQNFTVFRLLNIHMNKYYQKQVCHICGAGFSNLVFLNMHKSRSHRQFSCKQCDVNFKSKTDKKAHDISVHNLKNMRRGRFPCPYCEARFSQENLRVQHLVDEHGMKKPEHVCSICAKVFITRSLLNNHVKKVHMKEKNSECDVCHRLFYTKSDVARHKVTHTGVKKFPCSLCNNLFSTKDSLRRHTKRAHVGKL